MQPDKSTPSSIVAIVSKYNHTCHMNILYWLQVSQSIFMWHAASLKHTTIHYLLTEPGPWEVDMGVEVCLCVCVWLHEHDWWVQCHIMTDAADTLCSRFEFDWGVDSCWSGQMSAHLIIRTGFLSWIYTCSIWLHTWVFSLNNAGTYVTQVWGAT